MERQEEKNSQEAREHLIEYVKFIVDEQWPALRESRLLPGDRFLTGREHLNKVWEYVRSTETTQGNISLSNFLDQVEHHRIKRLFNAKGNLLPLFWYTAIIGYLATLLTLFIAPPTLHRSILISLYSSMVALVLVGIFILTHPYSLAAGIEPTVFNMMLNNPR